MFSNQLYNLKVTIDETKGTGEFVALFIIAVIYIFLKEKDEAKRRVFCYASVLLIFIILNPIFNKIVGGFFRKSIYWRFFWTVPISITVAYVATSVIKEIDSNSKKIIVGLAFVMLIMFSGKLIYNDINYQKVNNLYKQTDEDVMIANLITIDSAEYKRIICPEKLNNHLRQIEPSLIMAYPRRPDGDYSKDPIYYSITNGNVEEIDKYAKDNNFNYVIFDKNVELTAPMESAGFHIIYETDHYRIYKK